MPDNRPAKTIGADEPGLIILGMHRSGSSCLAGMLHCAGFSGGNVFLWNEDNRKGNQEDPRVIELNNLVLGASGGSWFAPPEQIIWTPAAEAQRDKVLAEFSESQLPWMFKDPRTVLTLPFWTDGIASPKLLGIFRNPLSAAQSLSTRDGFPLLKGLELWTAYNAALIREHELAPFPIVCFDLPRDEFVDSVRRAVEAISGDLVRAGRVQLDRLAKFFDDALVHQALGSGSPVDALQGLPGLGAELIARIACIYQRLCRLSGCEAFMTSSAGLRQGPVSASTLSGLIRIEEATTNGNLDAAYQACDEMLALSPRRTDLWMRLLGLAKASGDAARIDGAIKRGLEMLPDDPYLWLELAKSSWSAGNFDEAFRAAERAAAMAEDWNEPRLQLAAWEAGRQRWADVSKWLTPLVSAGKGNRWSRAMLGIAVNRMGNEDQGTALITEAMGEMNLKEKEGASRLREWASEKGPLHGNTRPSTGIASALAALQRELENVEPLVQLLSSEILLMQPATHNTNDGTVDAHQPGGAPAKKLMTMFPGRVFFDHLPKTAGTAVNAWLLNALGAESVSPSLPGAYHRDLIRQYGGQYSVISAHVHFLPGEGLDPRYQYMALLREPVDRVVSWVYYLVNNYDDSQKLRALAKRFLETDGQEVPDALKGMSNFYVDHFCRINGSGSESDDEKVANALAAIKQYDVVGLYQEIPRFLADAARLFGLPRAPDIDRVNVTLQRPQVDQISPALRERIVALNQLDLRFYSEVLAWKTTGAEVESPHTLRPANAHTTYRFSGGDIHLHTAAGVRAGNCIATTGQAGWLVFGPYVSLTAGRYLILVRGALGEGGLGGAHMDVVASRGSLVLAERVLEDPADGGCFVALLIVLNASLSDVEVRVMVSADSDLQISMIEISKWS